MSTEPKDQITAPAPAEAAPQAPETEPDDGDEAGDEEGAAQAGPEGPDAAAAPGSPSPTKKKRRRKKKKPGGGVGPEGPPVEGAEAHGEKREGQPQQQQGGPKPANKPKKDPPVKPMFHVGDRVLGKVTSVLEHAVMIDVADKALGIFDRTEFASDDQLPAVGDKFVAEVLGDGGRGGLVVLTHRPLREEEARPQVEQAFKDKSTILGLVTGVVKGGVEVYCDGLRAFAPASHVELRPGANLIPLIGQRLPFLVEQFEHRGRNVVLSRKAILEEEHKQQRAEGLAKLTVGEKVKGVVRSVVAWGFFVAIPTADDVEGLVGLSEMSHDFRQKPKDVVKAGEEVEVLVQKIDDNGKLWLSRKACLPDPWEGKREKYAVGSRHKGTVNKLAPFGAFVELEPGTDGLIHIADLSIRRIDKADDVVKLGQEIEVVVAQLDLAHKKIALHPAPPAEEGDVKAKVQVGKSVKCKIVAHDTGGLVVRIVGATGRNARGFIPSGQTGTPRGTDLRKLFPLHSEHEVKVVDMDHRRWEAKLSIKALKEDGEKQAYNDYKKVVAKEAKFGTFGDLLKAKLGG